MTSPPDWQAAGARIDALLAASATGGVAARERAEELVRVVADLYGAGLERVLDLLHEQGALTGPALDALASDGLVSGLLLVHGLHPYDVPERVRRALGGRAELVDVSADGVVRLRVTSAGCGTAVPAAELTRLVEEAAPEATAVRIEEAPAPPPLIPASALFARVGEGKGVP